MISRQAWTELVFLPDDTAIRTSEHHGTSLRRANEAWGHWVALVLDVQALVDEPRDDALALACLSAGDEFQASTYAALTGFYRQAVATLRPAIEGLLTGAYFRSFPDPERFQQWADGHRAGTPWASEIRKALRKKEPLTRFENEGCTLLDRDGWFNTLYQLLSAFLHGRPAYADVEGGRLPTTNVDLWGGSNGPVYEPTAFVMWSRFYFNAVLFCLLMVGLADDRVISIDNPTDLSYEAFLKRLFEWLPRPGTHRVAVEVAQYLCPR
jgi:hypothetical protein